MVLQTKQTPPYDSRRAARKGNGKRFGALLCCVLHIHFVGLFAEIYADSRITMGVIHSKAYLPPLDLFMADSFLEGMLLLVFCLYFFLRIGTRC